MRETQTAEMHDFWQNYGLPFAKSLATGAIYSGLSTFFAAISYTTVKIAVSVKIDAPLGFLNSKYASNTAWFVLLSAFAGADATIVKYIVELFQLGSDEAKERAEQLYEQALEDVPLVAGLSIAGGACAALPPLVYAALIECCKCYNNLNDETEVYSREESLAEEHFMHSQNTHLQLDYDDSFL
jgi:hypothetical protein